MTMKPLMNMKTTGLLLAAGLLLGMGATASAQSKTIQGEMVSSSGTVEAIDSSTRAITLRKAGDVLVTIDVPSDVKAFDEIKVGDTINVRYYDNVTVRLKPAG